jgi:hypothetical protein
MECGIERVSTYIKWLIGTKIFGLASNTIKNILYLKDCKLEDVKFIKTCLTQRNTIISFPKIKQNN